MLIQLFIRKKLDIASIYDNFFIIRQIFGLKNENKTIKEMLYIKRFMT